MTLRIGWLSPLTPASGIGTFSHAITSKLPTRVDGEEIDLTLLYPDHAVLHHGSRRSIRIEDTDSFRNVLELFDLLVYNIGNNTEHHELIFRLLRTHPGIVVCHDYVYQHYLADRSMHNGRSFASFAALLMKFGDGDTGPYLARSRITSRLGKVRYSPWDSDASALQPMSEAILDLGSALVVHSRFARKHAEKRFEGAHRATRHAARPEAGQRILRRLRGVDARRRRQGLPEHGLLWPYTGDEMHRSSSWKPWPLRRRFGKGCVTRSPALSGTGTTSSGSRTWWPRWA